MNTDKQDMANNRRKLVEWVKSELSASNLKNGEKVSFSPIERYVSAVLFPVDRYGVGFDPASEQEEDDQSATSAQILTDDDIDFDEQDTESAKPIKKRRYVPPSSVGFSFYVANCSWQIQLMASAKSFIIHNRSNSGRYKDETYEVHDLTLPDESLTISQVGEYPIFEKDGKFLAKFDIQALSYADGVIVTATLINNQELGEFVENSDIGVKIKRDQIEKTLFDVKFSCHIDKGVIGDYPSVDYHLLSDDEQEIELQYHHKKVYAVGHGAAVNWRLDNGRVSEIFADFMPIQEVPQVTADLGDDSLNDVLSMVFLAQAHTHTQAVCDELSNFIKRYGRWIQSQKISLSAIDPKHQQAGARLIARMDKAYERMQVGVWKIANDPQVAMAFAYANFAMAKQMKHPSKSWRAFQLAFILTTLNSVIDDKDDFRDVVDLIWFPTGGGKTEAYLGLTAFQILYRRLKYGVFGGGTTVLMRYTLKLLTTQQFLRACRLICALELIRRQESIFGQEPITIGLWVGDSASPNTLARAGELYIKAKQKGDFSGFVLDKCPCCDTPFTANNIKIDVGTFYFVCHQAMCDYQNVKLPCQVIDEMLYKEPPTLLLATIDKLAMLVWEERSSVFFGQEITRPPELIIQDELHLIANALGSVAGIYESALQTVISAHFVKPKYIASTATIKEAGSQVRRLFAKDLAIFPPQGLSCEDSFFAKTVDLSVRAGRLYVGYFAPLLNRQNNLAPLAGLLLMAPFVLFGRNADEYDAWADAWWTLLVYHGSLRGVGTSHTAFEGAVKKHYLKYIKQFFKDDSFLDIDINTLHEVCRKLSQIKDGQLGEIDEAHHQFLRENNIDQKYIDAFNLLYQALQEAHFDVDYYLKNLLGQIKERIRPSIKQLTSNNTASENARIFGQLDLPQGRANAVDVVLATNMVATGLDVGRLALMIINGQPLTTSEYIQASSRVGRSEVAGVVFINYYREQARSLSHYENFYPYHQSFYRFVEPTSVTPYTYQTRRRALHSALVIALRHSVPKMLSNGGANQLDLTDETICRVVEIFKNYCTQADGERAKATCEHIDKLLRQWQDYLIVQKSQRQRLYYHSKDKGNASLLYHHNSYEDGLWATLTNMRTVENSGILRLS